MTKDEAINVLRVLASELRDGLKHLRPEHEKQFKEAYMMAIEALKQTAWIPCSERLPEVGEDVLISYDDNVYEAHLRESGEYFLTHKTKTLVAEWEVDAWRELPKAYERGTE